MFFADRDEKQCAVLLCVARERLSRGRIYRLSQGWRRKGAKPPGKVSEGALAPSDWEKASKGGKAPFRL